MATRSLSQVVNLLTWVGFWFFSNCCAVLAWFFCLYLSLSIYPCRAVHAYVSSSCRRVCICPFIILSRSVCRDRSIRRYLFVCVHRYRSIQVVPGKLYSAQNASHTHNKAMQCNAMQYNTMQHDTTAQTRAHASGGDGNGTTSHWMTLRSSKKPGNVRKLTFMPACSIWDADRSASSSSCMAERQKRGSSCSPCLRRTSSAGK